MVDNIKSIGQNRATCGIDQLEQFDSQGVPGPGVTAEMAFKKVREQAREIERLRDEWYSPEHMDAVHERTIEPLRALIREAIETIKDFHGPIGWDIYYQHAPEMKRFRAAARGDDLLPSERDESSPE